MSFLDSFECVALINNLTDKLSNKVNFLFELSIKDGVSDSQIRMMVAEAKSLRDVIQYIKIPSSIERKK